MPLYIEVIVLEEERIIIKAIQSNVKGKLLVW
jgi:hypothetical protein